MKEYDIKVTGKCVVTKGKGEVSFNCEDIDLDTFEMMVQEAIKRIP